ncbi:MAG: SAM-dependent methyltransferase [Bacteroidetes bacterium]|nr:SAM-dependent methyltransferase [Bacteroidota bacterium]
MNKGKLYLIPVNIIESQNNIHLPDYNFTIVQQLIYFIVENAKEARAHLKKYNYPNIQNAQLFELNKHTDVNELKTFLKPILEGNNLGLLSDAGCPGVADPGSEIIKLAHKNNVEVIPLVGPSSILLSIMASGFNGQNFMFVGYLPVNKDEKNKKIKELENNSKRNSIAVYFIETPYRNETMFENLLQTLNPSTNLFVGLNIGASNCFIKSKTISEWKTHSKINFNKQPCVFGFFATNNN